MTKMNRMKAGMKSKPEKKIEQIFIDMISLNDLPTDLSIKCKNF